MTLWTAPMAARLTAMAAEGLSSAVIAATLSAEYGQPVSRNAVMGEAWRAGLSIGTVGPSPAIPAAPSHPHTGANAVTFLASREFACKVFLPGEPVTASGLVCGNPVAEGATFRFCPACSARLTVKPRAARASTFVVLGKKRAA